MPNKFPKIEEMKDILDIQGIQIWNLTWVWVLLFFLLVTFVVGLIFYLYQKNKHTKKTPKRILTPIEEALERLQALVNRGLIESGQVRLFYFSLSEIFRHFLERELPIQAEEATLEELKPLLKSFPDFTQEELKEIYWLLELSDLAKFARWVPSKDEIIRSVKTCRVMMATLARRREVLREESHPGSSDIEKKVG